MTATTSVVAGLAVAAVAPFGGLPRWAGWFAAAGVVSPPAGVASLAALLLWVRVRRIAEARRSSAEAESDVVLLADLLALGLGAGLSLAQALRSAADWVAAPLAEEVRCLLRAVRGGGAAIALASAGGMGAPLYRSVAAAASSGASLVGVVEGFVVTRRHAEHAARVEAARRLPVRLLVPLALLILPGFVLLAVGPALLDSLARLDTGP